MCPFPTLESKAKCTYIPFAFFMLSSRNAMPQINFQNFPHLHAQKYYSISLFHKQKVDFKLTIKLILIEPLLRMSLN